MTHAIQPALFGEAASATLRTRRKKPSKVRTVSAICKTCLESFTYQKVRRAQVFCSDLCRQISFRYDRILACHCCRACGIWFPSSYRDSLYCSVQCKGKAESAAKRKTIQCKGCSATFTVGAREPRLFCSPACRYAHTYPRQCVDCGTEFVAMSARQTWCEGCQGKYRRDHLRRRARASWDRLDYELRNAYVALIRMRPCTYCGATGKDRAMHVDHAIPLSRGGSDEWHNLVPACEPCNLEKHAKTPEEFAASRARKCK